MRPKLALTTVALALLLAAEAGAESRTFARLVDASQREGAISEPDGLWLRAPRGAATREDGAAHLPTATIDNDTRYVLAAHPHHLVATRKPAYPSKTGIVSFREPMADYFPDAQKLLVEARLLMPNEQHWRRPPPTLHSLEGATGQRILEFDIAEANTPPDEAIQLWVEAYQAPPPGGTRYRTATRSIPGASKLELAFGILEAAALQGPVHFRVSACQQESCEPLFDETLDPKQKDQATWHERSISLAALSGKTRSFQFEALPQRKGATSLPVWANPRVVPESPPDRKRPNVILLSIDTLRSDHLSVYGYGRETAPFIRTQLAPRGAVLDNMISEAATTDPSHMSLFTSLPTLVHGVSCCGAGLSVPVMTLAEAFREQGFATAAFSEGGPLDHKAGFGIGFDSWKENPSVRSLYPVGQIERVFGQAESWLTMRGEHPFFLFLHTFQVHQPHTPPAQYGKFFGDKKEKRSARSQEVTRYDREIRYVDDQLARLWAGLEQRGLSENTLFVLLSDHGEEFWEHGSYGHVALPYDEVLKVPLVVVGPSVVPGIRSQRPLHHVDVMPTLLELAGLPVPDHVHGQSFADLLRTPEATPKTESRMRTSAGWVVPRGVIAPAFAVRDGHLKLIVYRREKVAELHCFDLEKDPAEQVDLCAEVATPEARELLTRLEEYVRSAEAQRSALGGKAAEEEVTPLSPEKEEELRALGYID